MLLRPWHRVFDGAEWEALLMRCIVPKLAMALQVWGGEGQRGGTGGAECGVRELR